MIRLATIGTSAITERFIDAVRRAARAGEAADIRVDVAYSRDLARGRAFAERLQIPAATDDFAALRDLVDAVYVGSPNGAHAEQARAAIEAGLHVFLEKPATATAAEFADLVDAATARGVVVFEGMRNVYDPGFARIRELLPRIGAARRVSFGLSQRSARYDLVLQGQTPNIFDPEMAGGALRDLGVYPLSALIGLFGAPDRIVAASTVTIATGVDGAGSALLSYPGFDADIAFSKISASQRASEIQGEAGTLTIDRITDPRRLVFTPVVGDAEEVRVDGDENNMTYEVTRFARLVRGEDAPAVDQQRTRTVLEVVDRILSDAVTTPAAPAPAPGDGGPSVVAIIPARGGSKGVPRKNVLPVGGVPLVARAVAAARAAERVDLVVVTTDDAEIAAAAAAAGAMIVHRPAELSGSTASSESALLHALDEVERGGTRVGAVVFVQATSPFIDAAGIDEAVAMVAGGEYDAVFSAYETYGFLWSRDADAAARAINHDAAHRPRRQDREPHYLETGAFYVFGAEGFRRSRHRFFGRVGIVEVPEVSAIEIDDPMQLEIARAIAPLVESIAGAPGALDVDAVVTDFDGVHTDDAALIDAAGGEQVRVTRADGMGVSRLRRAGVPVLILSTETHPVVTARAAKLQVEVLQAIDDKAAALTEWAADQGIPLSRIAYLGNDVNDLGAMAIVGWPVAVADARPEVLSAARRVLTRRGGDGAVRELAELVLAARR